jgi:hypothetical protein
LKFEPASREIEGSFYGQSFRRREREAKGAITKIKTHTLS